MKDITVYKLDENGHVVWQYPAKLLTQTPNHVRLEAFFNRDDLHLDYTTFKRGDRFIEYFYTDRWYNIFAVYDRDTQELKGWYCNICRPAIIRDSAVSCEDLALDVWIDPQGRSTILDKEEFDALPLKKAEKKNGRMALHQLLKLAKQNRLPN